MARLGSALVEGAAILLLVALLLAPAGSSASAEPPHEPSKLSADKQTAAPLLPPSSQQQQQATDDPTSGLIGLLDGQLDAMGWKDWRSEGPTTAPSRLPTLSFSQLQQLTGQLRELVQLQQERCANPHSGFSRWLCSCRSPAASGA